MKRAAGAEPTGLASGPGRRSARDEHPSPTTRDRADRGGRTRLPGIVYALGAGIFLLGTTEFVIAGLLPEVGRALGVSVPMTGLLITAFAAGMVLGSPLMAMLTLRWPRRTTLVAALVVFAVGHVVAALVPVFAVALATRFVTAVATGTYWAVATVVVVDAVGEQAKARGLAVLWGGLTVATVAGLPLGTAVGQALGWQAPFWILAAGAAVMAAVLVPVVPTGRADAATASVRGEVAVFRSGRLWLALGTIAVIQAAGFGVFSYFNPFLTDVTGLPLGAVPIVLAVYGVGAVIGAQVGGRFGDRWPWQTVLVGMTGVVVAMTLLATASDVPWLVITAIVVLGVSLFAANGPLAARVIGLAGDARILASAGSTAAFNVGNTVGPAVAGLAISNLGLVAPAALAVPVVAVAVGLAMWSIALDRRAARAGE